MGYHEVFDGTTTTRLKLATGSNEKSLYSVKEIIPEYKQVLQLGQKDWQGGHGQFELAQPDVYFDGQSIDTTQEGRILLGPKITEVYQDTPASILKDSYNTGDDAAWSASIIEKLGQTFTAASSYTLKTLRLKMYRFANPGPMVVSIYSTLASKPNALLGYATMDGNTLTENTAGAWYSFELVSGVSIVSGTMYAIVIELGATAGGAAYLRADTDGGYAGGAAWSYSSGEWIQTGLSGYDGMFETYIASTTVMTSTPTCFLWASSIGKLLVADSAGIYYLEASNWVACTTTVAGVTDLKEYNGVIYAAVGASTKYWYSTDGDTWTQTTLTDGYAVKFLNAPNIEGTQNVLWKTKTPNEVSFTTDGKIGGVQWADPPTYVGDTTSNTTTPFIFSDTLKVGKLDNLWECRSGGGISPLMPELMNNRSTDNFKYVVNWQSGAYFSLVTGVGELIGANPGLFSLMGPLTNTGDIDKVGQVVGMAADTNYLYVAMLEGSVTHIYKGRPKGNAWSWCPWVYLGTNQCSTIAIAQHSPTDRRLWFGYGTHTGYVQITDNPTTDANARFAPSGFLRMSYLYGSHPYWDKQFQSIIAETAGCSAGVTVTPKYRKDSETIMSGLTAAITSNGVNLTNLTNAVTCKRIQFEVDLATNDSTITPQVKHFIAQGQEKPQCYRVHDCVYLIGESGTKKTESVRTVLRGLRTTSNLIRFADLRFQETTSGTAGTDWRYVVMLPGSPEEVEVVQVAGKEPELALHVQWMEIGNPTNEMIEGGSPDSTYLTTVYGGTP